MPTTSPSIVTSEPPELPGLAAASLESGRSVLACLAATCSHASGPTPRRPKHGGRCRTGSPPRRPGRPAPGRPSSASWPPAGHRAGSWPAAPQGRARGGRIPAMPRIRCHQQSAGPDLVDPGHDVQVGQDDPGVDNHHAGAEAALGVGLVTLMLPAHQHDRRPHRLVGPRRRAALPFRACAAPPCRCPFGSSFWDGGAKSVAWPSNKASTAVAATQGSGPVNKRLGAAHSGASVRV